MSSSHPAGAGSRSSHLTWPRTLLRITTAQGAGAHCQTGAQRLACARSYDWPDDTLAASADRGRPAGHHPPPPSGPPGRTVP